MGFFIVLMLFVTAAISWWNAKAAGQNWIEARTAGLWPRLLTWSAAVMSAIGWTYLYLLGLAYLASTFHKLSPEYVNSLLSLGYVLIIFPLLGAGMVITVSSWIRVKRDGGFFNTGLAAYNTFAMLSNTYSAITILPSALSSAGGLFSGDDDSDDWQGALAILLVVFAVAGGVLTTTMIVRHQIKQKSTAFSRGQWQPAPAR